MAMVWLVNAGFVNLRKLIPATKILRGIFGHSLPKRQRPGPNFTELTGADGTGDVRSCCQSPDSMNVWYLVPDNLRESHGTPLNPLAHHHDTVLVELPWMGGIPPFQTHPTALKLLVYLGIGWHASVCLLNSFNLWASHSYFCCNCGGGMWWLSCILKRFNCLSSTTLASTAVLQTPRSPLDSKPARKTCRRYVRPKTSSMLQPLWGGLRTLLGAPSSDDSERQVRHFDNIKMVQTIEATLVTHCLFLFWHNYEVLPSSEWKERFQKFWIWELRIELRIEFP